MKQNKEWVTVTPMNLGASRLTIVTQNKLFDNEITVKCEWDKIVFMLAGLSDRDSRKLKNIKGRCYQTTIPYLIDQGRYSLIEVSEDELIVKLIN